MKSVTWYLHKTHRFKRLFWRKGEGERAMNSPPPEWHLELLREREAAVERGEEEAISLDELDRHMKALFVDAREPTGFVKRRLDSLG